MYMNFQDLRKGLLLEELITEQGEKFDEEKIIFDWRKAITGKVSFTSNVYVMPKLLC